MSAAAQASAREARGGLLVLLTVLTLTAFAANSLLSRAALAENGIDAVTFTVVRLAAGVAMLAVVIGRRKRAPGEPSCGTWSHSSWRGGATLLVYAILFSLAYRSIPAGVGALVLFAFVQLTMLGVAVSAGEGPRGRAWLGVALALCGLAVLTLPAAGAPDLVGMALMAASGVAWGIYSLIGRRVTRPLLATAGNFNRALLLAAPAAVAFALTGAVRWDAAGATLAVASGTLASGLGYVLWYRVLPSLGATRAAVLQLTVPLIAAGGGILLLGEAASLRLGLASLAILGGVGLVLRAQRRS